MERSGFGGGEEGGGRLDGVVVEVGGMLDETFSVVVRGDGMSMMGGMDWDDDKHQLIDVIWDIVIFRKFCCAFLFFVFSFSADKFTKLSTIVALARDTTQGSLSSTQDDNDDDVITLYTTFHPKQQDDHPVEYSAYKTGKSY